jgi:hypothetical protein
MATTKERLDQLTRHPPEPNDHRARMPEGAAGGHDPPAGHRGRPYTDRGAPS